MDLGVGVMVRDGLWENHEWGWSWGKVLVMACMIGLWKWIGILDDLKILMGWFFVYDEFVLMNVFVYLNSLESMVLI